ncbi:hypothetical protein V6N13_109526 [Hibiscus sabdariffa]
MQRKSPIRKTSVHDDVLANQHVINSNQHYENYGKGLAFDRNDNILGASNSGEKVLSDEIKESRETIVPKSFEEKGSWKNNWILETTRRLDLRVKDSLEVSKDWNSNETIIIVSRENLKRGFVDVIQCVEEINMIVQFSLQTKVHGSKTSDLHSKKESRALLIHHKGVEYTICSMLEIAFSFLSPEEKMLSELAYRKRGRMAM